MPARSGSAPNRVGLRLSQLTSGPATTATTAAAGSNPIPTEPSPTATFRDRRRSALAQQRTAKPWRHPTILPCTAMNGFSLFSPLAPESHLQRPSGRITAPPSTRAPYPLLRPPLVARRDPVRRTRPTPNGHDHAAVTVSSRDHAAPVDDRPLVQTLPGLDRTTRGCTKRQSRDLQGGDGATCFRIIRCHRIASILLGDASNDFLAMVTRHYNSARRCGAGFSAAGAADPRHYSAVGDDRRPMVGLASPPLLCGDVLSPATGRSAASCNPRQRARCAAVMDS